MSYTPTVWNTGDTITAEKLNKLENGVASGGGIFVVPVTATIPPVGDNPYSTEVAFADVQNAAVNGKVLVYSIRTIYAGELRKIESAFGVYDVEAQEVYIVVETGSLIHSSSGITADGSQA